jgi:hypothetical protein
VVPRIVFRAEVFRSERSHRGYLRDALVGRRERDKPRLSLNNITAGVREREDANRTREAGNRDEGEGVANTLRSQRNGAVGFIEWLDGTASRFSFLS